MSLDKYKIKWKLSSPVLVKSTFTSDIYKTRFDEFDAILKILNENGKKFESKGAEVLRCFGGNGAVRLLNADEGAHLLEFVDGQSLGAIATCGEDARATEIICDVISKLHAYNGPVPSQLISMKRNFQSLFLKAQGEPEASIYRRGAIIAEKLIETERDLKVLHGDIHHENILASSTRGWLAIDPQCLFGERTYDFANTFFNPSGFTDHNSSQETIERRCEIFSSRFQIEPRRILEYAFAYGCLSAAWSLEDKASPDNALRIASNIALLLDQAE